METSARFLCESGELYERTAVGRCGEGISLFFDRRRIFVTIPIAAVIDWCGERLVRKKESDM